jgi:hypothetical protein
VEAFVTRLPYLRLQGFHSIHPMSIRLWNVILVRYCRLGGQIDAVPDRPNPRNRIRNVEIEWTVSCEAIFPSLDYTKDVSSTDRQGE